jgi:DNA modification methylase
MSTKQQYAATNLTGAPDLPDWANNGTAQMAPGTSIFDPVLCELAYRWFCPNGGTVLDPFAGGSVRGVIAAACGLQYVGVDLRSEQVEANRRQWEELGRHWPEAPPPVWHCSDSRLIPGICHDLQADLVFSCPPYADLEVYSDNPQDLSTLDYPAFRAAYREIIAHCVARLKPDRFACFVVGDVRDSKGFYLNFPADTIAAFQDAGCTLYNEAVLVTAIGSLPLRVGKQFGSGRKLGKSHQNVLVFYKGNPKNTKEVFGEVEIALPPEEAGNAATDN